MGYGLDIWDARDALDDHIRSWRDVRERGGGNAQVQAPFCLAALQGLRIDLFGDVLEEERREAA